MALKCIFCWYAWTNLKWDRSSQNHKFRESITMYIRCSYNIFTKPVTRWNRCVNHENMTLTDRLTSHWLLLWLGSIRTCFSVRLGGGECSRWLTVANLTQTYTQSLVLHIKKINCTAVCYLLSILAILKFAYTKVMISLFVRTFCCKY